MRDGDAARLPPVDALARLQACSGVYSEGAFDWTCYSGLWKPGTTKIFDTFRAGYNPAQTFRLRAHTIDLLEQTTSALCARVQRLEEQQAALRARLEGERQLQILTAHIAAAAQAAPVINAAIERFAEAMRAPLPIPPRGRADGLARAKSAWRYFDGTFMPESEKEAAHFEEYERYAAGGRARAESARRFTNGTFAPRLSFVK